MNDKPLLNKNTSYNELVFIIVRRQVDLVKNKINESKSGSTSNYRDMLISYDQTLTFTSAVMSK